MKIEFGIKEFTMLIRKSEERRITKRIEEANQGRMS